jgi:beta-xylosidase
MIFNFCSFFGLLTFCSQALAWNNPIRNPGGSDPFVVYTGGYYYLLSTTWSDVEIARATTVAGLETATKKVVYTTTATSHCCNVWAPEVHYLGGKWYIYYTAGESTDLDGQRLHVLTGTFLLSISFQFKYNVSNSEQAVLPPGIPILTADN